MAHVGPFLQYLGYHIDTDVWRGSVMILSQKNGSPPILSLGPAAERDELFSDVKPDLLDELCGWCFWRYDIAIQSRPAETAWSYRFKGLPNASAEGGAEDPRFTFYVPGIGQCWHWGFHSCSGLSADQDHAKWGGPWEFNLWRDVLKRHAAAPMHAIIGGGDQIYNDEVWTVAELKAWIAIPNKQERQAAPFSPEMEAAVTAWYCRHYCEHFSKPEYAAGMAVIPQMMQWDDHDIFDGWGSYPSYLQGCQVFQGVYTCARRCFLLFQQHSTPERAAAGPDLFGPGGRSYSWLRMLGRSVAVLAPDTRAERTKHHIIQPEAYEMIFQRLQGLPTSCQHLVVVLTVPIVFPALPFSEGVWRLLNNNLVKSGMQKTGLAASILGTFDEAKLLDDIVDHWDAGPHRGERQNLITRLQGVAEGANLRVSFVSGDVHCCGVGRLYTNPKMKPLRFDHRFMPQITSSAIVNAPPPDLLITLLHKTNRAHVVIKPHTREKMVRVFRGRHPSTPKLLARRNWCEIVQLPEASPRPMQQDALQFVLRVEDPNAKDREPETYEVLAPKLWRLTSGKLQSAKGGLSRLCFACLPEKGQKYKLGSDMEGDL